LFSTLRLQGLERDGYMVNVKKETHEALNEIGHRGETFDDIIMRLIDFYKKNTKK
jgi:hypothetical protein